MSIANRMANNTLATSLHNIEAHYDLSNGIFKSFLSSDMMYSCAIFGEEEGGLDGDVKDPKLVEVANDKLHEAQMRKVRQTIEKAQIRKGDRVLDIGGGWGTFAIEAVQSRGCQVDAITLSIEQKNLADARIKELGLEDSILVHLMDYRAMPPTWCHRFDRIVSIGMIEHVGEKFLAEFYEIVDWALKEEDGVVVTQCITTPESRYETYAKSNSVGFIRKYIFPGRFLPSLTFLAESLYTATRGRLTIDRVDNIGPHYARTLRCWGRRFEAAFESEIMPALRATYPDMSSATKVEEFRRKWRNYFASCASGFTTKYMGDHVLVYRRDAN